MGVVVILEMYLQYCDTATLEEHYNAMAAYMNYMTRTAEILGKTADADKWRKRYEKRKADFAKRFFDAEGYALNNVLDNKLAKLTSKRLAETVRRQNVDDKEPARHIL